MSALPFDPLDRRTRWLSFLLPLALLSIRLGGAPLFDVDEGAFSEATREMFERGDFLSTFLNGAPRYDKPILIYWLQAVAVLGFGTSEFAFRLPSVLASALWCHAVAVFAAPRIGSRAALFACGIAATCLGVFVIGRAATADALLNLLIALTLFDAWRHIEDKTNASAPASKAALYRAYLWIALGVLTKGPVAIVIPAATVFLYALVGGRNFRIRDALRMFFDPLGWLILVVVAAPWYVIALVIHGRDFIDGFLLRHNVERFTGTLQGHSGSAFYYLLMMPLLLWPWLAWLVAAIVEGWRGVRTRNVAPLHRFLWIWCIFVIVFFSLSGTKLPHYALYGATPLFVLCAAERERVKSLWLAALPVLLVFAFVIALPDGFMHAAEAGWIHDAYYRAMALRADAALPNFYRPIAWIATLLALIALGWHGRIGAILPDTADRTLRAAVIATGLLCAIGAPYVGEVLQGPVKRAALVAKQRPEPATLWNFHMPSFSVYRERVTPLRAPEPGELALTRIDRLSADAPVETLYIEGGVVLVKRLR